MMLAVRKPATSLTHAFEWLRSVRNVREVLPFGVIAIPFLQLYLLLWLIWTRTPQVPWWDEWNTVGLVADVYGGKANLAEFWALHNEHRILIPRIIDVVLITLTRYNRQVELTFGLAVALASGLLLLQCAKATLRSGGWVLAVLPLMSLFFFSLSQYDDWTEPFQIAFITTVFGVSCTMVGLAARPVTWRSWCLATLGALIASFSSAGGLMAWIAFLPGLWGSGRRKIAAWITIGVVVWILYFRGYPFPAHKPALGFAVRFFLTYLGAPVGFSHPLRSEIAGLVGLIALVVNLAVWWRFDLQRQRSSIWLQLVTYALLVAAVTTEGRAIYGSLDVALYSKYQTSSALFWVGLIMLSARSVQVLTPILRMRLHSGSAVRGLRTLAIGAQVGGLIVTGAIVLSAIQSNVTGFKSAVNTLDGLTSHQWCIQQYQTSPDSCVADFIPVEYVGNVRLLAAVLDHYHLAIFSRAAPGGSR
jgi:hypothetical protein